MLGRTFCLLAGWCLAISVAVAADVRREIQIPDIPGYRTLKCDFHCHTVFSDGLVWPTVRVQEAWREGLDVLSITDHIEVQPFKNDVPTNYNRSYELAEGVAKQLNILLIRGTEVTRDTPPGHFNALFLSDVRPLNHQDFYEVFRQAKAQQAFVFWNHPGWQGKERGKWGEAQTRLFEEKCLHGIEVGNGDEVYEEVMPWAHERNLAILANSDIHSPSSDIPYTAELHRTMTLVFARNRTTESVREALFAGRTAAWCGNRVFGRQETLGPLFRACVEISPPLRKDDNGVATCEVTNRSSFNLEIEHADKGKPTKQTLLAGTTARVGISLPTDAAANVDLRVLNFVVAPGKPLTVAVAIPSAPTEPGGN